MERSGWFWLALVLAALYVYANYGGGGLSEAEIECLETPGCIEEYERQNPQYEIPDFDPPGPVGP